MTTVLDSRRRLACSASASLFLASSISSLAWVKRASDYSFRFLRNSATFSRAAACFLSAFTRATRTRIADDSTWLVCNPASSGNLHLVSNRASLGTGTLCVIQPHFGNMISRLTILPSSQELHPDMKLLLF